MGILSAIGSWFKRTFGKSTASAADYRRLTKAELKKIGLSEKSERFVRSDIKRITKASRTVSKRAVQTAKLTEAYGEKVTPEKLSKPKISKLPKYNAEYHDYRMPTSPAAFDRRMKEILKKYAHQKHVSAAILIEYGQAAKAKKGKKQAKNPAVQSHQIRLDQISFDQFVQFSEKSEAKYGVSLTAPEDDDEELEIEPGVRFYLRVLSSAS